MIVWLASYPRSGITFARIALHYLFGISSRTVYPIADDVPTIQPVIGQLPPEMSLAEMAAAPEHCFVKTHEAHGAKKCRAGYRSYSGSIIAQQWTRLVMLLPAVAAQQAQQAR